MGMLGVTPSNDRNTDVCHALLFLGAEHLVILITTTLHCLKRYYMNSVSKDNTLGLEA